MIELSDGHTHTERALLAFFDPCQYTFISRDGPWTAADEKRYPNDPTRRGEYE